MKNTRITIRMSETEMGIINIFLKTGEFASQAEMIRRAVREFSENHMEGLIKKTENMRKLQNLVNEFEVSQEYLKK